MLEEMPHEALIEWRAFDLIEPFGFLRDDWHAASITAGISNVIAASVRSRQRFKVEDFLLRFRTPEETAKAVADAAATGADWKRMKFVAMICAAGANADQARESERQRKRRERKEARDEAKALTVARADAAANLDAVRAALMRR